jgi:hypothetical protein
MAAVTKYRAYGKITGFWIITQKPLMTKSIKIKLKKIDEKSAITPRWVIRFTSKLQDR